MNRPPKNECPSIPTKFLAAFFCLYLLKNLAAFLWPIFPNSSLRLNFQFLTQENNVSIPAIHLQNPTNHADKKRILD